MRTIYQLFDLLSGNVIAAYAQECDAWDDLRHMATTYGLAELHGLGLLQMQDGQLTLVAMEDELVRRVARHLSEHDASRGDVPASA